MEIKPIKQKKEPNYPTLEFYIKNPEMLLRNVPENWIKNKLVATSLAAFIFCGNTYSAEKTSSDPIMIVDSINKDKKPEIQHNKQDSIKVAPIFAHGDGSGATGCIVMSPPVFISEDEARKIIFDAFKAENILFDTTNCPVLKFKAPAIANSCYEPADSAKVKMAKVEIRMDGYNAEYNLAIEFVSTDDYLRFSIDDGCFSSVQGFHTKEAAEMIRKELIIKGKTNAAVFYDPIPSIRYDRYLNDDNSDKNEDTEIDIKELAKKQLLEQVSDFIKWIKDENIIKQ